MVLLSIDFESKCDCGSGQSYRLIRFDQTKKPLPVRSTSNGFEGCIQLITSDGIRDFRNRDVRIRQNRGGRCIDN